jgi:hypothetical protein
LLRYQIAFALRRAAKIVRGLKLAPSEDERFAVADDVVDQLKQHGDPFVRRGAAEKRADNLSCVYS